MQQQPGQNMAQAPLSTLPVQSTLPSKQQQSQSAHSTFHQINHQKSFNVVSLLKSTTAHQLTNQQHQHHHQSQQQQQQQLQNQQQNHHHSQTYNNILNRTVSAVSTSTAQPIICQISSSENGGGNVFTLNQRIIKNLDTNGGNGSNINASAAGNGGIVGLNVGCIDNRKYEYKNKLLNNNFQAAQEYNPPTGGNLNTGGSVRANQQTGHIFRAQAPNSVQRNTGTRHMPSNVQIPAMYPQTMQQNMMLPNFPPYQPRQTAFQTQQFAFPQATLPHYYPIPYFHPSQLPQAPLHPRTAVGVTTNGTVSVGNAMSAVQAGPNGPLAGPASAATQAQVPMTAGTVMSSAVPPPGSNTVLGVGNTSSTAQVGVGVNVSPMVAVVPPVTTQSTQSTKPRPNALPIINPITNKSIFEDYEVSNRSSNSESEYIEPAPVTIQTDSNLCYQQDTMQQKSEYSNINTGSGSIIMMAPGETTRNVVAHSLDSHHTQHHEMIGQTPVVSAMSDAPSIEILPSQPKIRSKKIPIVAPKDDALNEPKDVKREGRTDSSTSSATEEFAPQATPAFTEKNTVPKITSVKSAAEVTETKTQVETQQREELNNSEVLTENVPYPQATDCHTETECNKNMDIKTTESKGTPLVTSKPAEATGDCANKQISHVDNYQFLEEKIEKSNEHQRQRQQQTQSNSEQNVGPATAESSNHTANIVNTDETDRAAMSSSNMEQNNDLIAEQGLLEKNHHEVESVAGTDSEELKEQSDSVVETVKRETEVATVESLQESSDNNALENHVPTRIQSLIHYNEGQWSPHNPSGKKQYDREQLLLLREAKASRVQPEVNNSSILPQPNLMPTFARINPSGKRVQSMVAGGHRGGDGGGTGSANYGNKQSSMSGVNSRNSTKGVIRVNLSLNQDVKLNETDNAWRPRVLQKGEGENDPEAKAQREKEDLLRRVRGILNKLTPEKFDALVEEIIKLKIDTPDKMEAVMILVFEKAVDEPNFSVSYALLCHRLINEVKARDERMEEGTKTNLSMFRNSLLDKTEREFIQNVTQSTLKQAKLQPIIEKIKECADPTEKAELEAQLEEEELKIRRRSGGTVRFIGELFKISMLTGKIIYSCVEQLLNPKSEDMLECLCKLLTTVGAKLEKTPVNSKDPNRCYSLDKVIARMQAIASKTDKEGEKISSRVRFMLQDVIDLRKNKWQSKKNEAPKTMGQIEKEAKSEQLSSQYMNYGGSVSTGPSGGSGSNSLSAQMGSGGGKRGDDRGGGRYNDHRSGGGYSGSHSQRGTESGNLRRQPLGNSNANNGGNANGGAGNDDTWHVQTSRGRSLALDSNKLEALISASQDMGNKKMGGMSMFVWNNQSRPTQSSALSGSSAAPSNPFAALSSLDDRGNDRDRDNDRDRSGPRNKGSYNKNSMERERDRDRYWNDRNLRSRTGSSQLSRESSSSRSGPQSGGLRSMNASSSSAVQKSASHSKYTQQMSSRATGKPTALPSEFSKNLSGERNQQTSDFSVPPRAPQATPAPAVFEEPTDSDLKIIKSVLDEMVEVVAFSDTSTSSVKNAASSFERIKNSQKCGFLYYVLADYLHLRNTGSLHRRFLAVIVAYLIETHSLSVEHFHLAYSHFCEIAGELMVDIPDLWLYIFQFTGPLITKQLITVKDLWIDVLKTDDSPYLGKKFLKAFLNYCTRGIGPSFTRNMWKKSDLKWTDFMPESDVEDFVKTNKFSYIENETIMPYIDIRNENKEAHITQVVEHIKHLLKEGGNADSVIDYINGNVVDIERPFIRSLTKTLCEFAITYQDGSYKLDVNAFQNVCIPILQRYIELKEERELECLYSMQLLVHDLEHPRGLLCELFAQLYDSDVIPPESFVKWRDSKDQSAGKGVAVKGLNSFFNQLLNSETSDENN